jgi:hypothetical protein
MQRISESIIVPFECTCPGTSILQVKISARKGGFKFEDDDEGSYEIFIRERETNKLIYYYNSMPNYSNYYHSWEEPAYNSDIAAESITYLSNDISINVGHRYPSIKFRKFKSLYKNLEEETDWDDKYGNLAYWTYDVKIYMLNSNNESSEY